MWGYIYFTNLYILAKQIFFWMQIFLFFFNTEKRVYAQPFR